MEIKVLGTGCARCKATVSLIERVAGTQGIPVTIEKIEEMDDILAYGVMSTPAVVIDGQVVHAGGIPSPEKVQRWLSPADKR